MASTPDKPKLPVPIDELRARIPGWGADLDPKDRPSVPRDRFDPIFGTEFPARQPELWPRERSIEHKFLTPVFGTSCPPRGLSGRVHHVLDPVVVAAPWLIGAGLTWAPLRRLTRGAAGS